MIKFLTRTGLFSGFFVLGLFFTSCSHTVRSAHMPAASPAHLDYTPPKPESWSLPNGLTVMLLRDDEVPLVSGFLMFKGGSLWEDPKAGDAVDVMGAQLREGGAGELNASALDRRLEDLAADIGSGFSTETGSVSFSCLQSDFKTVFSLFSDVVLRPRFDADRIEVWRGAALDGVKRRKEEPEKVVSIALSQLLFGDSVYGHVSTSAEIKALTRSEILRVYDRYVRPDGAVLAIGGAISREEVEALVADRFGSWKARGSELGEAPSVNFTPQPGVYFVPLPFQQSSLIVAQQGVKRLTPDYVPIELFNTVFSQGFGSRLISRVRDQLGLAYNLQGAITPGVQKGVNYIFIQTKGATVGDALRESLGVLNGLRKEDIPAAELAAIKQIEQSSFIFKFDTIGDVLQRAATQRILAFPPDYDATFLDKVDASTAHDIQHVARRRWDPAAFVTVVVGDESAYNSLVAEMSKTPDLFHNHGIRKVKFDEKLDL